MVLFIAALCRSWMYRAFSALEDLSVFFPLLLLLILVNVFVLLKIPALTASIFSGSSSGHDGGVGMITTAVMALG